MQKYLKILRLAFRYKTFAALNIFFNLLQVIFNLASLLLFIPFLRLLFGQTKMVDSIGEFSWNAEYIEQWFSYKMSSFIADNHPEKALLFICILIAILFLLKNFCRYMAMYFIAAMRVGTMRDMRASFYEKIVKLPLSFHSEERKGDLLSRIMNDVQEIEFSILNSLELVFRDPIAIVLSLGLMIFMSPQLTLFSLFLLPIGALVIGRISKSLKRTSMKAQSKMGDLLARVEETLSGLRIIKAFNAEKISIRKFGKVNDDYRNLMTRAYRKRDLASPLSEFLGSLVMIALVWYGGNLILDPKSTTGLDEGKFIGYIIVFSQLLRPVQALATAWAYIQKGAASVERFDEIMETENIIQNPANPEPLREFREKIEFKNVSFSYTDKLVLDGINLVIPRGHSIALVGESGGGKSTLADLLPRFYDVTAGSVEIDGVDVRKASTQDVRSLMGIVTQQSILFNDTVFNNIAFANEHATHAEVEEAARIANAHDFILELEDGYQTNIGDMGQKLSGGQQQRLSIARAVLANPPILILDEATSALDTESEKLVQEALFRLMENRTSLVIAHRLSTIQHAHEILVLQEGKIVERGTHNTLLELNGVYKNLCDLQSFA